MCCRDTLGLSITMKRFIRIISLILLPIVQSAFLLSLFIWPEPNYIICFIAGNIILTDILLFGIVPHHLSYSERFMISWPPLAMSTLVAGVLLFLDIEYLNPRYIVIGVNALLQIIYLTHLYYHYYRPD